jgi:hypothetical protein
MEDKDVYKRVTSEIKKMEIKDMMEKCKLKEQNLDKLP